MRNRRSKELCLIGSVFLCRPKINALCRKMKRKDENKCGDKSTVHGVPPSKMLCFELKMLKSGYLVKDKTQLIIVELFVIFLHELLLIVDLRAEGTYSLNY